MSCSLHNKSWWQPLVQRTASQGTLASKDLCLWTLFLPSKEGKYHWITVTTVMQDTGHPGKQLGTLQVVSIFAFLPENVPWYILCTHVHPCDIITTKTMPPSSRAYLRVYCVQKWSKSDWQFQRYWHFCTTPLLETFQSDHYQLIHLRHGFRSNATTTYIPVCPGHSRCYCQCADS